LKDFGQLGHRYSFLFLVIKEPLESHYKINAINPPMNFQMTTQIALIVEFLPALRTSAREFLGSSMDRYVVFIISQLAKLFPTVQAFESLLLMGFFVNLKFIKLDFLKSST
jgi:hypothetical protein